MRSESPSDVARRTGALVIVAALLSLTAPGGAHADPAPPPPPPVAAADTLGAIVERWAAAAGGWPRLAALHGARIEASTRESGVAGVAKVWITHDGYRRSLAEGRDRSEEVRHGERCWVRDWNGKTLELQGRDRSDRVTAAFARSLVYTGFSKELLATARARYAGDDTSGRYHVVRLEPPHGIPLVLFLDASSGLPARASRTPYDDAIVLTFGDWRTVAGVQVPFDVREASGEGTSQTSETVANLVLAEREPSWRFAAPDDRARDVRFARGNRATGIPFSFENDHIMVECRVNGTMPIWFMFDTGADVTVINRPRLAEFGLEAFGAATTSGGGNSTDFAFTRVAKLDVGGASVLGQRNGVIDLSGLERIYGMPLGGILGYDFVSRFVVVIDYGAHTMSLYLPGDAAAGGRGERVPFVLEQGHPHVRGRITVPDGEPIDTDFVIDSGAAETANLTAPFVRAHRLLERARRTPAGAPNVMAGSEKQFFAQTTVRGRLNSLSLCGVTLTDIPVNLQQGTSGAYASASFSGTVGQRILRRFTTTYDYARGVIALEPNAEFAQPFAPRTTFGVSLTSDGSDYTTFKVTAVRKDSPAAAAGLKAGDIIAALDDKPAARWRLAGIRTALAAEGSAHTLDVTRNGDPVHLAFTVKLVSIED